MAKFLTLEAIGDLYCPGEALLGNGPSSSLPYPGSNLLTLALFLGDIFINCSMIGFTLAYRENMHFRSFPAHWPFYCG